MRILIACVLLVAVGCGDDDAGDSKDSGVADSGSGGSSGKSGSSSTLGGTGGKGGAGTTGGVGAAGRGAGTGGRSGGSGVGGHGGAGGGAKTGMIKLVPNVVAGKQTSTSGNVGSQQSALRVGQPTAMTLLSLKYYVTSIQLCESLELMGSGFNNAQGCISLYQNMPAGSPDYNEYTVAEAKDDNTPGRYIDLMSADGQAALRKPVMLQVPIATDPVVTIDVDDADGGVAEPPPQQAGVYRYGLINFYRPIKVKAQFPILGEPADHYFRTKAVTLIHEMPGLNGGLGNDTVDIGNSLMGDTEETTYMLNNGGALFVFQKPFAITQADVDAKAEINIDLVFNPESFGQAYETDCSADVRVVVCDRNNTPNIAFEMQFVRMSPVPRKTGEQTHKETYLVDYDSQSKVRIELYYNNADPESGIQGVDTALVYNPAAPSLTSFNTIASNFVSQSGSVTTNDASVSLKDYRLETNLEGLRRRQDGTVTVHCLFLGSVCTNMGDTFERAYTYEGDTLVSGGN